MAILNLIDGYKTYLAALGLLGLALYQVTQGQYDQATQSFLAAFGRRASGTPSPRSPSNQGHPMRVFKDYLTPVSVLLLAGVIVFDHLSPRVAPSPEPTVNGETLGRAYSPILAATYATAWEAAAQEIEQGKPVAEAQQVFQSTWQDERSRHSNPRFSPASRLSFPKAPNRPTRPSVPRSRRCGARSPGTQNAADGSRLRPAARGSISTNVEFAPPAALRRPVRVPRLHRLSGPGCSRITDRP